MKTITIYGASDDLIEVEGAVREEFNPGNRIDEEGVLVAVGDGTLLRVKYTGQWKFEVLAKGPQTKVEIDPATDEEDNYTDKVTLTAPAFGWVATGSQFARETKAAKS